MQNLPIHHVIPQIITALLSANRLVLQAPPGAGKTTAVPIALLGEQWVGKKQIIMLEPRRLAARNAAARMAELLGEKVGETVGYQIRADRCIGHKTKIIVVTEGILTRMLQSDPALEHVALLIFDEFHERNLHGDLALALSLQSQELLRNDLKLLVMSATLNTDTISTLLDSAPVITSEGRSFSVENIYLDAKTPHPTPMQITAVVSKTVTDALRSDPGSILLFLPGVKEIRHVESTLLKTFKEENIVIAPLYGEMSKQAQDAAIRPAKNGVRKIVLATNIAESSLTIEGITIVIDAGLQRVSTFNSGSGMNRLHTVAISQDAATQRSGRAGRLSPGKCYRLWHEHRQLARHSAPEIRTSDLTPMMLELANWGVVDVDELRWLDLPAASAVEHAQLLLKELGALKGTVITKHGKAMLALGTHPRLAHMMLKASNIGLGKTACLIAALLSEKDIFTGSDRQSADLSQRVTALQERHSGKHIDKSASQRVLTTASGFLQKLNTASSTKKSSVDMVGVLLGFAYPDRIAKCRDIKNSRYLLSGGKGAKLTIEDSLFGEPFLVIADLDVAQTDARIYSAATVSAAQIEEYFSALISKERLTRWKDETARVEAREVTKLGAIILDEKPVQNIDKTDVAMALIGAIKEKGLDALTWSKEGLGLRQRVQFLNYSKEKALHAGNIIDTLPDVSDKWLLDHIEIWLLPHLDGVRSFKACQKLNTYPMLLSMLSWEQQQHIYTLAPPKIKVPSGSSIFLNYENPASPVLAVRLQELFGMVDTPLLINGTVPITVELLSPAHRPMQVTKDLKSFWENTYEEVKKELRGKYKKHYWPDDPYTAQATSKTKKNM
ncbi:MAG: ATP-dependent helicase HrpB [Helicobacteraceae bacterium]|jgi:ATP-dependent helicase HrpB|nr:ATP-dependent helicase HrpB [Helicobacteraceae bacterium]